MKKLLVSLIVLVFAAVPLSAQNLVVDGSFEGLMPGGGWLQGPTDGESLGAWTAHTPAAGVRYFWLLNEEHLAPDGTTSAHLGDGWDWSGISQLVSGFVPGQLYELSLAGVAYGGSENHPGATVQVANLTSGLDALAPTIMPLAGELYVDEFLYSSFQFTASNTELDLSIFSPGSDGENNIWAATHVDDVSITLVPEPATMCLLGLGGLFLRRRR